MNIENGISMMHNILGILKIGMWSASYPWMDVVVLTTTNNSVIHDGHMDTLESVGIPYR